MVQTNNWLNSIAKIKDNTINKLKNALSKTRQVVIDSVAHEDLGKDESGNTIKHSVKIPELIMVDKEYLEDLEESLIKADIGLEIINEIIDDLSSLSKTSNPIDVQSYLSQKFTEILEFNNKTKISISETKLNVFLIIGVNGTGKTTSIGKLANKFRLMGKKVIIAAGDTFRAAAESQLEIWAKAASVDIVRLQDGANSSTVVYQALEKAYKENYDVLIIDTAGRLHNKVNLMDELKKIKSVIDKHGKETNLNILLTLDASCGQNGLQQASTFTNACGVNGVILTKLDGTAKGGVVFNIATKLEIPVAYIGLGESIEDLKEFDAKDYVEALLNN